DSQKELQTLRDELLRPIAERASAILNAMATEQGYVLIVDISNPQNNVLWFNPANDVTAELTRRIDASASQTSGNAPAGSPPSPRPANPAPGAARPPAPATPPAPRPAPTPSPAPK